MAGSCELIAIIGPTASGKSDLALALARRATPRAEILSVDSMQVYRHMDIGTAKPGPAERAAVPHHLIDVVEPTESYTVARYVQAADEVMSGAAARGAALIATGGTPLYFKALFEGLFDGPPADPMVREKLRALSNEQLLHRLRAGDPEAASRIHLNDTKRLVRAVEVLELTGRPITSFQSQWGSAPRHRAIWIGLDWDRDALNRRINARVKNMLAAGWADEVRHLLRTYGALSETAAEATGYRELIDHLQGRQSLHDATEQIKIATRQLARRQMKWFRRFPNVTWLRGDLPTEELADRVLKTRQE